MRTISILLVVCVFLALASPMVLYWWGKSNVSGLPASSEIRLTVEQNVMLWEKFGGNGEPAIKKLNPYTFIGSLICQKKHTMKSDICSKTYPGLAHASYAVRDHIDQNIQNVGNIERNVSWAAYTIWATKTWSIDRILGKLSEQNL